MSSTNESDQPVAAQPASPEPAAAKPIGQRLPVNRKTLIIIAIVIVVLLIGLIVWHGLRTASTDDAYVNSYVTFVSPRVSGQVARVLVDDNNRVKKDDVLVELDPEPYRVQVAIKEAALEAAQADQVAARARVRGQIGQARSLRFNLQHAIEEVDNQVAVLRVRVATLDQANAALQLARADYERVKKLTEIKVTSQQEFDEKQEAYDVARAQVQQAAESVRQQRVSLGLPKDPGPGKPLDDTPADLDQTFSTVRQALGQLMQSAAALGVHASSYTLTPQEVVDEFYRRYPGGDIDKIYAEIITNAPALKQAEAKVMQAERDLDSARLDLRYCTVVSEIDGVVTRRNVNPGNHVQVGQSLMAIRSLTNIWVDANFKETQLSRLRIGQEVELKTDMYGSKHLFKGRISGFTMGTGSTLALLPAQNASGNFVKVVQRLPVRIDLVDYDPARWPLFVGISVEPEVDLHSTPTGPNAGKFLQDYVPSTALPVP